MELTNRMVIRGNGPGEAGDQLDDRSPSGVSRGMVKVICPVLTARDGETDLTRGTAPCPDPAMLWLKYPEKNTIVIQQVTERHLSTSITSITLP